MTRILQAVALVICFCSASLADDGEGGFSYEPPVVKQQLFGKDVNMLARERDEYATNLSTYVANQVIEEKASAESLSAARRILALAMHLSPRNRQALIVNGQLRKGVIPQIKKGDYSASVLSRLLLSRSRILSQAKQPADQLLARCFVELAATIDPRNEDAVFAYEIQRLDFGDVDWDSITDAKKAPASDTGGTAPDGP